MRFTITLFMSLIVGIVSAQAPQGVGYQGVATDSEGIELVNQAISIRASILSGSVNGTVQWQETHDTTTDEFGLFALTIGEGVNTGSGLLSSFADIPWGESTYFLQIEMDATGGMDYSLMGVNQMMSVPYALYAESTNLDYDSIANYLSGDSTFVTNISSGLGGGGCSYQFPEGVDGIGISLNHEDLIQGYTVPNGKRLYVTYIENNIYGSGTDTFGYNPTNFNLLVFWDNRGGIGQISTLCIANAGTTVYTNQPNTVFGILVDERDEINALHAIVDSGQNYTVPEGKKLYLLNSLSGEVALDNHTFDFHGVGIINSGVVISAPNNRKLNGYLVDEDYFADCGGGGSSEGGENNSSVSGGCDIAFPDGLYGDLIDLDLTYTNQDYTVPAGKRLYITHFSNTGELLVDGISLYQINMGFVPQQNFPIVVDENQIVSATTGYSTNIKGFLVDISANITPLTYSNVINPGTPSSGSYNIPSGKLLIVTFFGFDGTTPVIDMNGSASVNIYGTLNGYPGNPMNFEINQPLILNSNDALNLNGISFNGYLVDEDYFADCGGGGSSEGGSVSSLDSLTIVNMINDALSNSVSIGVGDYYGGGVVGYIFQPGDADYILGETHGYTLYFDNTGIQWGCIGLTTNVVNNNIGQGPNNTQALVDLCPESNFAAKWCNDLVIGPHSDWFLPTYEEAILIDLSFYLNILNSSSYVHIWLSEEFSVSNLYDYNCPSCSSANTAWVLYNSSGNLDVLASNKNNTQEGNFIAFRKF
jgi:hypothetical protein